MLCKSCHSLNNREFPAEINIHFPGLENLTEPTVFVFPKLLVCLDCGFAEFSIPETELPLLAKGKHSHAA
jgi:hypothetical protein